RMLGCESRDVNVMNDRPVPRRTRRLITSPGKCRIHDDALLHAGGTMPTVKREIGISMSDLVPEQRIVPFQVISNLLRVWIEQKLVMIEAHALRRLIGSPKAKSVQKAGAGFRKVAMPDLIGLLMHVNAMKLTVS